MTYAPFDPPPYPQRVPPPRSRFNPLLLLILGGVIALVVHRFAFNAGTPAVDPRPVTPRGELAEDEKSTINLFEQASPSVVFITTLSQRINLWTRNVQEIPQGTGSGFIWDDNGHIVTNFHVVRGATGAQVTLSDHSTYPAELVGVAPDNDLAVLRIRIPANKLRPIPVGTSAGLKVGQKVFAIGNPFGLDQTLTTGIVSALNRTISAVTGRPIEDVIQTDAAINPGNSGGPLLDSAARLIGVNTAIYSPSGSSAGIGFAVPVDTVNRIVPQLIRSGRVASYDIGLVRKDDLSAAVTRQLGVQGVMVLAVKPNSPADQAGIQGAQRTREGLMPGDIIQKVGDRAVRVAEDIDVALQRHNAGDVVTLTIWRKGQVMEVAVTLPAAE